MPKSEIVKISRDDWKSVLGEGIHTGFRKGSSHPESHNYWLLIKEMPDELWDDVLGWAVYGLEAMKLIEVSDATG